MVIKITPGLKWWVCILELACPRLNQFFIHRWLAVNLEFIGNGVVLAAAILSVMGKNTLSPGIVGLAVSHSLQVRKQSGSLHCCTWPSLTGQHTLLMRGYDQSADEFPTYQRKWFSALDFAGDWNPQLDCQILDRCGEQYCFCGESQWVRWNSQRGQWFQHRHKQESAHNAKPNTKQRGRHCSPLILLVFAPFRPAGL